MSYNHLSSSACLLSHLLTLSIPKIDHEALSHPGWRKAIIEEMKALDDDGTWGLIHCKEEGYWM